MRVEFLGVKGNWREVADAARTTVGMEPGTKEPSSKWKKQMLHAEHSPIRKLIFKWKWHDLLSWVSVHFVRHKHGIEHWIRTQRTDRTGVDRNELKQSELVIHECEANVQELIYIARKRLCMQASPETREAFLAVLNEIEKAEPEVRSACVPECIYRGFCPELKPCGYTNTEQFKKHLQEYREVD